MSILIVFSMPSYGKASCNELAIKKDLIQKAKCTRGKVTYRLMELRGSKESEYCYLSERNKKKSYSKSSIKGEILHSGYIYKFKDMEFFVEFTGRGGRSFIYLNNEFTPCKS